MPIIKVKNKYTDTNFLLEDNTILHLEFQATALNKKDLIRFGHYDLELYKQRQQKIHRVIIFTPETETGITELNIGSIQQNHSIVHLDKNYNSDAIYQELQHKLEHKEPLQSRDKLNIILYPMISNDPATRSKKALDLTLLLHQNIHDDLSYYLIGAMLAANYSLIQDHEKNQILEVLKMAQPFQDLYQELEKRGEKRGEKREQKNSIIALLSDLEDYAEHKKTVEDLLSKIEEQTELRALLKKSAKAENVKTFLENIDKH